MGHNRKIVIGSVALVKARLKHDGAAMTAVGEELDRLLGEAKVLQKAPFKWIGLVIRYGLVNRFTPPHYQRINKRDGDLPIAVEIDTHLLLAADLEQTKVLFRIAAGDALLHVARKYSLDAKELEQFRNKVPSLEVMTEKILPPQS